MLEKSGLLFLSHFDEYLNNIKRILLVLRFSEERFGSMLDMGRKCLDRELSQFEAFLVASLH